jgi:hypothetical protein
MMNSRPTHPCYPNNPYDFQIRMPIPNINHCFIWPGVQSEINHLASSWTPMRNGSPDSLSLLSILWGLGIMLQHTSLLMSFRTFVAMMNRCH